MYVAEGAPWEGDQRPAHPVPLPQALLACALVTVSPTHVRCVCGSSSLFTAFLGWDGMPSLSRSLSLFFSQGFFSHQDLYVNTRTCPMHAPHP